MTGPLAVCASCPHEVHADTLEGLLPGMQAHTASTGHAWSTYSPAQD